MLKDTSDDSLKLAPACTSPYSESVCLKAL
jgi:hypothetical protein